METQKESCLSWSMQRNKAHRDNVSTTEAAQRCLKILYTTYFVLWEQPSNTTDSAEILCSFLKAPRKAGDGEISLMYISNKMDSLPSLEKKKKLILSQNFSQCCTAVRSYSLCKSDMSIFKSYLITGRHSSNEKQRQCHKTAQLGRPSVICL